MNGEIKQSDNFIAKFLRGGYSLAISFWGFGLSLFTAMYLTGWIVGSVLVHSPHLQRPVFFVICVVELILKFLLIVGIWNAGKYYGGLTIWIWCARIVAILLFAFSLFIFAVFLGV